MRQTRALVDSAGRAEAARLIGRGVGLEGQGLAAALRSGPGAVTAGTGALIPGVATLAVVRFEPETRAACLEVDHAVDSHFQAFWA